MTDLVSSRSLLYTHSANSGEFEHLGRAVKLFSARSGLRDNQTVKITNWNVHTPDRMFHVFVEIETDAGISGWGAGYSYSGQLTGALEWLKRFVMGENPLEVERVTEKLHQTTFWLGRGGAMTHAISAVNIALWDLAGKALGQPVSVLLGGRYKNAVPVYGSVLFVPVESLGERIQAMRARGFRAIKLGWDPFGRQSLADDEKLIRGARQAAGDDTTLLIDAVAAVIRSGPCGIRTPWNAPACSRHTVCTGSKKPWRRTTSKAISA